jgi:hypothetical protein
VAARLGPFAGTRRGVPGPPHDAAIIRSNWHNPCICLGTPGAPPGNLENKMARKNGVAEFAMKGTRMMWDFGMEDTVTIDILNVFPEYAVMNEVQQGVVRNGLKQKLADSIAGVKNNNERFDRMVSVRDALLRGEWTARTAGGGSAAAILAEAIAEVDGRSLAKCREYTKGLKPAAVAALSVHPLYKGAVDRIVASRATAVDVAALLGEIDGI